MASQARSHRRSVWIVPVAVLLAAGVLLTLVVTMNDGSGAGSAPDAAAPTSTAETTPEGSSAPQKQDPESEELATRRAALIAAAERHYPTDLQTFGPLDAPVTLVVFSDYQCPFCAKWNRDTLPAMVEKAKAGDLRIEVREANVFGEASERAARAAYAAALQDRYSDYNDALFADGERRPDAELTDDALVALADTLGLDTERFTADMTSEKTRDVVAHNAKLGRDLGAFSTPAFLVNGRPLVGAQPTHVFVEAVEQALAETRG